ncbi:uncharacterized protein LOC143360315 [Halictus rubicundus]|uniref:uncharacterized protein LOC143360315 n=1 Tax=Halictus rubicundus TaxID=77578 RepID=UPI004035674C
MVYSDAEKIEMILVYGETKSNSVQASQLYAERYPERNHPSRQSFDHIIRQFCKTESIKSLDRKRSKPAAGEDAETFAFPKQVCPKYCNVINFIHAIFPYIRSFMAMTLRIVLLFVNGNCSKYKEMNISFMTLLVHRKPEMASTSCAPVCMECKCMMCCPSPTFAII